MSNDLLYFNGVNGASGEYLLPPLTPQDISKLAQDEQLDAKNLAELKWRHVQATTAHLGVKEGVDPKNLAETGWGVIFAHNADPAIRDALHELLAHRRQQATQQHEHYYQEYIGVKGIPSKGIETGVSGASWRWSRSCRPGQGAILPPYCWRSRVDSLYLSVSA